MIRQLLLALTLLLIPAASTAVIIDRIAATVDHDVITTSAIDQLIKIRFYEQGPQESDSAFRRRVLDALIAQLLRYRDAARFGAEDVPLDAVEARLAQLRARFPGEAEFEGALSEAELSVEEVKALLKRQIQVEAYVEERFSPLIFVPLEEIERYYREVWVPQRQARGLAVPPLAEVREDIRTTLKADRLQKEIDLWTEQLRSKVNIDIFI